MRFLLECFRFEKQRESRTSIFRLIDTCVQLIQEGNSKRGQNNTLLLMSKDCEGQKKISLTRLFRQIFRANKIFFLHHN